MRSIVVTTGFSSTNYGPYRIGGLAGNNYVCWSLVAIDTYLVKPKCGLAIAAVVLILWLLRFGFHVVGTLIHLLLVTAVGVLLIDLLSSRRTV